MAPHGTLMEHLVACFNVICGRFPRAGERVQNTTGVLGLTGPAQQPKAQVKMARPELLTNGAKARVRDLHTIAGQAPTAALADEILMRGAGRVRALFTVGGNPVLAWPDQTKVVKALETLDLHVALDIRMSATARLAPLGPVAGGGLRPAADRDLEHPKRRAGLLRARPGATDGGRARGLRCRERT